MKGLKAEGSAFADSRGRGPKGKEIRRDGTRKAPGFRVSFWLSRRPASSARTPGVLISS